MKCCETLYKWTNNNMSCKKSIFSFHKYYTYNLTDDK